MTWGGAFGMTWKAFGMSLGAFGMAWGFAWDDFGMAWGPFGAVLEFARCLWNGLGQRRCVSGIFAEIPDGGGGLSRISQAQLVELSP